MKKNSLAVLLGFAFAVFLFGTAEIFFRWNEEAHWLKKKPAVYSPTHPIVIDEERSEKIHEAFKGDPVFQWRPLIPHQANFEGEDSSQKGILPCCIGIGPLRKSVDFLSIKTTLKTHQLMYRAHFTIDGYGRRITIPQNNEATYNILLFGDSFTLGEGVNNEDTFASQLAKLRPDAKIYNMGTSGSNTNEFLYELQLNPSPRLADIPRRKTILLYSLIDADIERTFCRSSCLRPGQEWISHKPFYKEKNNEIQFAGFFDKDRPLTNFFYRAINNSAFLQFFDVVWPPAFTENDFNFLAKLFVAAKQKAEKDFPDVDFYVVLYPFASANFGPSLRQACEKQGLKVLDYSNLDAGKITENNPSIPNEDHPSPITHYIFANLLNKDLPTH